jgi:hypothetical protein
MMNDDSDSDLMMTERYVDQSEVTRNYVWNLNYPILSIIVPTGRNWNYKIVKIVPTT